MIKDKWRPENKVFLYENGLKFTKSEKIFPKMGVSPKKVFTFYAGLLILMQRSLEVSLVALLTCH